VLLLASTGLAVGLRLTTLPGVPFNNPRLFGQPAEPISLAIAGGDGAGGATYGQRCSQWLQGRIGSAAAVITPSCTAALELAALAIGLQVGDEVVMPSFAFPSLAAAVALRGARPVFVDIRPDTLGLDEARIEQAITSRTRAICTLNYAGVAGDVDRVRDIADAHGLRIVEDNAHGLCATYRGRPLGSFGDLSALSFHATKNVQIGEGGALLVNDPTLVERVVTLKNKGTNRSDFDLGLVAKYEWVELGTSPLIGEVPAALLWSQLLEADEITAQRRAICAAYRDAFSPLADKGLVELPFDVPGVRPDGHAFCVLAGRPEHRPRLIGALADAGIQATFHYVPLHASPAGRRYGRTYGSLPVTERVAATIIRLPVWPRLPDDVPMRAAAAIHRASATASLVT
jgi:dTDP-4-amino-4,6-dideoxygalactose transaminase